MLPATHMEPDWRPLKKRTVCPLQVYLVGSNLRALTGSLQLDAQAECRLAGEKAELGIT